MKKLDKLMMEKRKYPKIICDDKELISDIGSWLGTRRNIKKEFGRTLLSLGFKTTDEIVLCKYNRKTFSFTYVLNGRNPYKKNTMWLNCGYKDGKPGLILTTGTRKTRDMKVYKCSRDNKNRIDNNFVVTMEDKILSNGVNGRCIYNDFNVEIEVDYPNDYSIRIEVEKPYNGLLSEYEKYFDKNDKLKNEEQLMNTLIWFDLPLGIEEIYKDICDICFTDVSVFPKFVLSIEKFNDDKSLDDVVDKIELRDGELKKFVTTRNGRQVTIDNDGNWEYEINRNGNTFVLNYEDEQLVSGIIWGSSQDDNEEDEVLVSDLRNSALEEVERVKKIARTMVKK